MIGIPLAKPLICRLPSRLLLGSLVTMLCAIAYRAAGMNWLDAICHAFAALSLGGFSTHDASVGYFNSPLIEFVLIGSLIATVCSLAVLAIGKDIC